MDIERVQLVGGIDALALLRITNLAQQLGLRVLDTQVEPNGIVASDANLNATSDGLPATTNTEYSENAPFRRVATKASFQAFGYDALVDESMSERVQRVKKSTVTSIWNRFAEAQFADRTYHAEVYRVTGRLNNVPKALKPEGIIGVPLPQFGFVSERNVKYKANQPVETFDIAYIEPGDCDNIDLDGLAQYIVAVAERLKDLAGTHKMNGTQAMSKLKTFIPRGLGFASMHLLADYCFDQLVDDQDKVMPIEQISNARTIFARCY